MIHLRRRTVAVGSTLDKLVRGSTVVALLLWTQPSRAQDSGPIDTRVPDANNQVGSFGYNPPTPDFRPSLGNLIVTGNVTAGRSFQAFSPVRSQYGLRIGLPSAGLSGFRRDSVALDDVLSGRSPAAASPYYSRQWTATSAATLSAGFERYGLSRTGDMYTVPLSASKISGPQLGAGFSRWSETPDLLTQIRTGQVAVTEEAISPFARPLTTFEAPVPTFTGPLGAQPEPGPFDPTVPQFPYPYWPEPDVATDGVAALGRHRPMTTPLTGLDQVATEEAPEAAAGLPVLSITGANVFDDLTAAVEFMADAAALSEAPQGAQESEPSLAAPYRESLATVHRLFDEPAGTFAGSAKSAVQQYMRAGEERLRAGEFYAALSFYERAAVLDRTNPLVLMGQGHALLAAGEYYRAAHKLSRAVELFPAIAFFKLDLTRFITDSDLLERRRADLEHRLAEREDYRFRFVLGYIESYTGFGEYGLENLRRAAEQAPPHSGIADLHRRMIMGRPKLPDVESITAP
ncbi:MAG: tetratricopeptide repeat protein [bacterium]|nr:tetratricopeptide repeat protein [bacterium]